MNFKHDQGIMPEFALVFPTGDLIRRNATTKYDQFKVFFNTETATIRENGDRLGSIQCLNFKPSFKKIIRQNRCS